METRARHILIGLFVVVVVGAGFGFVYWLNSASGLGARVAYEVRFSGPVSGLMRGSAVLFNGIRVGEVTGLALDADDPGGVVATIAVAPATPIAADTRVDMDYRGLTGTAAIALAGGAADAPPLDGTPPVLVAEPGMGDLTQAARQALGTLDRILTENAEPLRSAIASIDVFADALARNSDKLDGIVAGLERLTGGGAQPVYTTFDLTAPAVPERGAAQPRGQIAVIEPTTVLALDSQRIIVEADGGTQPAFDEARWADLAPILIQARLIQAFENAGHHGVDRDMGQLAADYRLAVDLRDFHIATAPAPVATVAFSAKLVDADGRAVGARLFSAEAPVASMAAAPAAAALDEAFGLATRDLVLWALDALAADEDADEDVPL